MLKAEENEMLTRVERGTPGGEWLRSFWLPIAISDRWDGIKTLWQCQESFFFKGRTGTAEEFGGQLGTFTGKPTAVRILAEDLVLFRNGQGNLGLLGLHCPHRGASLEYGRVHETSLECCYHGWTFDMEGNCTHTPAEDPNSRLKDKVKHTAYEVKEMGGFIWAYMGAGEAPILPRLDVVAREDGIRAVENFALWPCNYFQILENSPDVTHTGILHGGSGGGERSDIWYELPRVKWDEKELGIVASQIRTNYVRTSYIMMPNINRLPQPWPGGKFKWPRYSAIFRTPVDNTHTLMFSAVFTPFVDGRPPELPEGITIDITDQLHVHRLQDYEACVSQGEIFDRTSEVLGASDGGVIMLRKMIMAGIQAVQEGRDPKGVMRGSEYEGILDLSHVVKDSLLEESAA